MINYLACAGASINAAGQLIQALAHGTSMNPYSVKNIHRTFKQFDKQMRDLWESYALIEYHLPLLRRDLHAGATPLFSLTDLKGNPKVRSVKDTAGAMQHILVKAYPRRTLLEGVALFEDFRSGLVEVV